MKIKITLLLLLLLSVQNHLAAQAGTWALGMGGAYLEDASDIAFDGSGNAYLTGYFQDTLFLPGDTLVSQGSTDIFLLSFDDTGTLRWAKSYGGPSDDFARKMVVDDVFGCYLVGEFRDSTFFGGDTIFTTNPISNNDLFVLHSSLNGSYDTTFTVDSTAGSDFAYGISLDGTGNIIITGKFRVQAVFGTDTLENDGFDDFFIAKMDPNGNFLWARKAGGRLYELGNDVAIVGDTAYYVAGYFQDTCYFNDSAIYKVSAGAEDILLVKFSSNGDFRWVKTGGGAGSDKLFSLESTATGDLYACGTLDDTLIFGVDSLISHGNYDALLMKWDANGNLDWMKASGGQEFDAANDLALTPTGNIAVTGYFQGNATFDTLSLGTSDPFNSEVFISHWSPSGNLVWINRGRGPSSDEGSCIGVDPNGFTWVAGYFVDSVNFGQSGLNSRGLQDLFLVRLNTTGGVFIHEPITIGQNRIEVYPNPSQGDFYFSSADLEGENLEISIFDLNGQLIANQNIYTHSDNQKLELNSLPSGIYILKVKAGETSGFSKFVIAK